MTSALALLFVLGAAQVAPAPAPTSVGRVTRPQWDLRPTGEMVANALSEAAKAREMSGWAVMKCDITIKGGLRTCKVIAEGPDGFGFGRSALKLSSHFSLKPATLDGKPVAGGTILIPITFGSSSMGNPRLSYAPGRPSFRLTPIAKKGAGDTVIACPSTSDPSRICKADEVFWKDTPPLEDTAPIILDAKQASGASVAYCKIVDGKISGGCQMEGENGPLALAAVGRTLPRLKDPRLMNGDALTAGIVAIVYDWTTLSKAAEAIIAASDEPPSAPR